MCDFISIVKCIYSEFMGVFNFFIFNDTIIDQRDDLWQIRMSLPTERK